MTHSYDSITHILKVGWNLQLCRPPSMPCVCMQDPANLFTGQAHGYVVGQIYYDAFQARYRSATGAVAIMGIPLVAAFFCGSLSVASSSRCLLLAASCITALSSITCPAPSERQRSCTVGVERHKADTALSVLAWLGNSSFL